MRIKPVFGTVAGILCVAAWIGTTIGDVLQSAEDPSIEIALGPDVASQLVPTVIGQDTDKSKVTAMTEEAANLAQSYEVGEATCQATLAHVDQCLGALQTDYASCQDQPYWESSHNQLMSIRSDLPCCGGSSVGGFIDGGGIDGGGIYGGEQVVPGSEQVIGEQVIDEQIVGPVPMDEACLPAPPPIAYGPEPIGYGGGCCGGGGGGGLFGGGTLLGLAGLGIGIAALADDDDDGGRTVATPTH